MMWQATTLRLNLADYRSNNLHKRYSAGSCANQRIIMWKPKGLGFLRAPISIGMDQTSPFRGAARKKVVTLKNDCGCSSSGVNSGRAPGNRETTSLTRPGRFAQVYISSHTAHQLHWSTRCSHIYERSWPCASIAPV